MKKQSLVTLVVAMATVAMAADLLAQGRGGRGGFGIGGGGTSRLNLLQLESVQEELGLEEVQIEDIQALRRDMRGQRGDRPNVRDMSQEERREAFSRMREEANERQKQQAEKLADILDSDQMQRLNGIYLQVASVGALSDPVIQEKLNITDQQQEEIRETSREAMSGMRDEMREAFQAGDRDAIREKMTEVRSKLEEEVMGVLSAEQKEKYESMKGEKFELSEEDQRAMMRGGRGGRGPGDGQGRRGRGGRPPQE